MPVDVSVCMCARLSLCMPAHVCRCKFVYAAVCVCQQVFALTEFAIEANFSCSARTILDAKLVVMLLPAE